MQQRVQTTFFVTRDEVYDAEKYEPIADDDASGTHTSRHSSGWMSFVFCALAQNKRYLAVKRHNHKILIELNLDALRHMRNPWPHIPWKTNMWTRWRYDQ